ncbi:hypothetical protein KIPB_006289 [Kipferlia bialata]|uniref:Uncharacterized protein n=1 Tax=Kipferlia bialata TaxID=797122 RepID=A0A391NLS2_9EUKA|nr:hypothetical protein KIPB_006289 [Kipferlia bialata]|eukprot:g6289.t1
MSVCVCCAVDLRQAIAVIPGLRTALLGLLRTKVYSLCTRDYELDEYENPTRDLADDELLEVLCSANYTHFDHHLRSTVELGCEYVVDFSVALASTSAATISPKLVMGMYPLTVVTSEDNSNLPEKGDSLDTVGIDLFSSVPDLSAIDQDLTELYNVLETMDLHPEKMTVQIVEGSDYELSAYNVCGI